MPDIDDLMLELDGADAETVNRIAWEKGSLPVRLAMLGLASSRKTSSPLWWGYPPGVFVAYKWDGEPMRDLALEVASHVRALGYRVSVDVESLDEEADAYFQIPEFISSLQNCTFYVLLLTELAGDLLTGRKGKTSWLHDEYQHAVRLCNSGRLIIVPVLLEPEGTTEFFTRANTIDLTDDPHALGALDDILAPDPIEASEGDVSELASAVARFDRLFLNEQWNDSAAVLRDSAHLGHTFDHKFRRMLLSIYTADSSGLETVLDELHPIYGTQIVSHIYGGYCALHHIPNRSQGGPRAE